MGRGRARIGFAAGFALAALVVAGCGSSSHPNDPRPQSPTRISVTLNDNGVIVQPQKVAFGQERNQQIPQNQNHAQPPIKTDKPLMVVFVIANQTDHPSILEVHGTHRDVDSPQVPATSPGAFPTELPTGAYFVTATKVSTKNEPTLVVGPVRSSSQNDVLLP